LIPALTKTPASLSCHRSSSGQFARQLGILFLNRDLSPRGFGIRQRIDEFSLGTRKLGSTLKILQGVGDLALLQQQLGHRRNSDITLCVN
jgi:hypothetical protein